MLHTPIVCCRLPKSNYKFNFDGKTMKSYLLGQYDESLFGRGICVGLKLNHFLGFWVDCEFLHPDVDKLTETRMGGDRGVGLEFLELRIENCSDCLKHVCQALFVGDQMLDAVFQQLGGALFDLGIKSWSVGFEFC